MGDCYGPDHPCDPLTDIAANPLDADFLMGLEPAVGEHVFFGLLHNTMGEPEVYRRVADAFFAYCRGREIISTWFQPVIAQIAAERSVLLDLHIEDQDHTAALLGKGRMMAAKIGRAHV